MGETLLEAAGKNTIVSRRTVPSTMYGVKGDSDQYTPLLLALLCRASLPCVSTAGVRRSCFSPRNLHPLCAMTCALAPRKDVEDTDTLVSSSLPKKERVPISPPASAVANASSHDLTSTGLPHVAIFSHSSFLFLPPKGR